MSNLLFKTIMSKKNQIQLPFDWVMDHVVSQFCAIYSDMTYREGALIFKRKGHGRMEMLNHSSDEDNSSIGEQNQRINQDNETEDQASWRVHLKKIVHVMAWMMMGSSCFAQTMHISMNPDKRMTADISKDSMNRVAITGDRITQVFGDSESYELQIEEASGQIFIKPVIENGDKPLSLTLITEKNITQDLLLQPCDKEAVTIILKSTYKDMDASKEGQDEKAPSPLTSPYISFSDPRANHSPYQSSYQESLIAVMKKLLREQGLVLEECQEPLRPLSKDHQESLRVSLKKSFHLRNFKGYTFEVKNITQIPMELKEEIFFQQGDLAMSLLKHSLKSQEETTLYVVVAC